jgi:hypothetical protein
MLLPQVIMGSLDEDQMNIDIKDNRIRVKKEGVPRGGLRTMTKTANKEENKTRLEDESHDDKC